MKAEKKNNLKNLGLIVGGLAMTSFGASANTADMFSVNAIGSGGEIRSELTQMAKNTLNSESYLLEAKCGEEGAKKGKAAEAKCGEKGKKAEAKCGEGKCGEEGKKAEAKCGEGKCGEEGKKAEAKCGEKGKKAEAKCGEGKCGEKK